MGSNLKRELVRIRFQHQMARAPFCPDTDPVVLIGQVLDSLEVKRLDDSIGPQVILSASWWGLNPGLCFAIHLGDPHPEFPGLPEERRKKRRNY